MRCGITNHLHEILRRAGVFRELPDEIHLPGRAEDDYVLLRKLRPAGKRPCPVLQSTGKQSGNDDDGDRAFGTLISANAVD